MKKITWAICLILIIFTLSGCAKTTDANDTTNVTFGTTAEEVNSTLSETITSTTIKNEIVPEATTSATTLPASEKATQSASSQSVFSTSAVQTSAEITKQTTTKVTTTKVTTTKVTTTKPVTTLPTQKAEVCYVTIVCSTINNNINSLKDSKKPFVPSDGIILNEAAVEVSQGDTAFDIIKKACKNNTCKAKCSYCKKGGIQIEYTYTPAFDNYYIEGIHQIYEKDCGTASGWMYSVNGVFPNVGVSAYSINPDDKIVFAYTCDMGEDIGNIY